MLTHIWLLMTNGCYWRAGPLLRKAMLDRQARR